MSRTLRRQRRAEGATRDGVEGLTQPDFEAKQDLLQDDTQPPSDADQDQEHLSDADAEGRQEQDLIPTIRKDVEVLHLQATAAIGPLPTTQTLILMMRTSFRRPMPRTPKMPRMT